jgi:ABC-type transport system involved in multi-copper enzyme maturation permease subunit
MIPGTSKEGLVVHLLKDVWLIARFDLVTAIRTKRALLAILVYALGAFLTAAALVQIDAKIGDRLELVKSMANVSVPLKVEGQADQSTSVVKALSFLVGGDEDLVLHLLQIPLVVLGFFWTTLTFLPFLIALVSHDLVNIEVRNRSARFILLRTSRAALLLGKTVSHLLLFLSVTVVSNLVLCAYAWNASPSFDLWITSRLLLRFWLLTIPYGFCFLALTALVSSLVDGGAASLAANAIALIAISMLSMNDTIGLLSPSFYKLGLWSPRFLDVLGSSAAFLVFGTLFLSGAYARLRGRDL